MFGPRCDMLRHAAQAKAVRYGPSLSRTHPRVLCNSDVSKQTFSAHASGTVEALARSKLYFFTVLYWRVVHKKGIVGMGELELITSGTPSLR
jgi:hypothetical protein